MHTTCAVSSPVSDWPGLIRTLLVMVVSGGLAASSLAQTRSERSDTSSGSSRVRAGSDVLSAARARAQARSPIAVRTTLQSLGGGNSLQRSIARRDGYSYVMGRGTHTEAHTYFGFRPVGSLVDGLHDAAPTRSRFGASSPYFITPPDLDREVERRLFERRVAECADVDSNAVPAISYEAQAAAAASAGNYESARRLYVRAMLARPSEADLQLSYALAHLGLGEYTIAALAVRRSLVMAPDLMDAPPDLRTSDPTGARLAAQIRRLEEHLAGSAADTDAWFLLGYLRHAGGNHVASVEALQRAVSLDPDDIVATLLHDAAMRAYLRTVDAATPTGQPSMRE